MNDLSRMTPESIREMLGESFPGNLGIEPLEIDDECCVGRLAVDRSHLHPGGYVHGGVWTALGDTVAAWASFRNIPAGADFTTIELKLNVFGSGLEGDTLIATATPLHVGRSTIVIEVRTERQRAGLSKLAANLIVTNFVIPPAAT